MSSSPNSYFNTTTPPSKIENDEIEEGELIGNEDECSLNNSDNEENYFKSSSTIENTHFNKRERSRSPSQQIIGRKYKVDLCKYFVMGKCSKGTKCSYSHVLKDFPCKYYIATGNCDNHAKCKFAHRKLSKDEMFKFLKDNKKYIMELRTKGIKTRIERFIDNFLASEDRKERMLNCNTNSNIGSKGPNENIYNSNVNYKSRQGYGNVNNNNVNKGNLNSSNNHYGNNNIIMNYQMLNNAVITGAIQLMNNIYFNPFNSIYAQQKQQQQQQHIQGNALQMNLFNNVVQNVMKGNNSYGDMKQHILQHKQQEQQEVNSNSNNSESGVQSYASPLLSEENNNTLPNSNNNKDEKPNPPTNINHRDPRLKKKQQ